MSNVSSRDCPATRSLRRMTARPRTCRRTRRRTRHRRRASTTSGSSFFPLFTAPRSCSASAFFRARSSAASARDRVHGAFARGPRRALARCFSASRPERATAAPPGLLLIEARAARPRRLLARRALLGRLGALRARRRRRTPTGGTQTLDRRLLRPRPDPLRRTGQAAPASTLDPRPSGQRPRAGSGPSACSGVSPAFPPFVNTRAPPRSGPVRRGRWLRGVSPRPPRPLQQPFPSDGRRRSMCD